MQSYNFWRRFRRVALFGLLGVLTVLSGWANKVFMGDVYPYKSVDRTVGLEALERSQGVTTDGTYWFFSGRDVLLKTTIDGDEIVARSKNAIPDEFREQFGSAHIGGISYANGYVYAAIEDSGNWEHPIVALFDSATLNYSGKYAELPGKSSRAENAMTHGVPWVACDTINGYFYVAQCDDADKLFAYDLNTFEYVRAIPLSEPIDEIQGAEMYNGCLYAATNDATRAVYRISLLTGTVDQYFDRILYQPKLIDNFGGEGEDITVLPMRDGTVFHALDIGALFIDANLRHYEPILPEPTQGKTYLEKYVLDKIKGGVYTLDFEYNSKDMEDMANVPMSFYKNSSEGKVAFKAHIGEAAAQKLGLPAALGKIVDIRIVGTDLSTDHPHIYFAWPGGYCEISDEDFTQSADMLKEYDLVQAIFSSLLQPGIEYRGFKNFGSYVTETFVDPENKIMTVLYYDYTGIAKVELIDMKTNEVQTSYTMELRESVPAGVFQLSGKKYSQEEMRKLFEGMAG